MLAPRAAESPWSRTVVFASSSISCEVPNGIFVQRKKRGIPDWDASSSCPSTFNAGRFQSRPPQVATTADPPGFSRRDRRAGSPRSTSSARACGDACRNIAIGIPRLPISPCDGGRRGTGPPSTRRSRRGTLVGGKPLQLPLHRALATAGGGRNLLDGCGAFHSPDGLVHREWQTPLLSRRDRLVF
jgi:hypothetical protein